MFFNCSTPFTPITGANYANVTNYQITYQVSCGGSYVANIVHDGYSTTFTNVGFTNFSKFYTNGPYSVTVNMNGPEEGRIDVYQVTMTDLGNDPLRINTTGARGSMSVSGNR